MENFISGSIYIIILGIVILCIAALIVASAQKDQSFDKLDISRKFVLAVVLMLLFGTAINLIAIVFVVFLR